MLADDGVQEVRALCSFSVYVSERVAMRDLGVRGVRRWSLSGAHHKVLLLGIGTYAMRVLGVSTARGWIIGGEHRMFLSLRIGNHRMRRQGVQGADDRV